MIRIIDYYDLIELPDGSHIPVPIAIRIVGLRKVLEIPIAKKKRDNRFYFCKECRESYCLYCDYSDNGRDCGDPDCPAGFSFFKCRWHTNYFDPFRQKVKEIVFKHLVESPKLINLLKYIEIDESQRWRSIGSMEVAYKYKVGLGKCGDYVIVSAEGKMKEIAQIEYIRDQLEDIKALKNRIEFHKKFISVCYERIAEALNQFLPDKFRKEFDRILNDVKVECDKEREIDDPLPICLKVIPNYKLTPKEWHYLLRQLVVFLYKVLPEEVADLIHIWLETELER